MSTEDTIADLTLTVSNTNDTFLGLIDDYDAQVAAMRGDVDAFLAAAQPEHRFVQDIFIGGSADFLYPVWWLFPHNIEGGGRITICRHYSDNGDTRPLNPSTIHQAGLLLEIEGLGTEAGGDADFIEIKRFNETYNATASHISFEAYSMAEPIDPALPMQGYVGDGSFGPHCRYRNGMYLRGGGLSYRIIKNWTDPVEYHDGSNFDRVVVREHTSTNTLWYAEPIPFADLLQPNQSINAFVDAV